MEDYLQKVFMRRCTALFLSLSVHFGLFKVIDGQLPINHHINAQLQDIFNLMPNLSVNEVVRSFAIKTNDMLLVSVPSHMTMKPT